MSTQRHGFTLLELVMALAASAVILAAIYGVFSRAVHLRDDATARTRESRVRAHAAAVIRDDLRHAFISGSTTATSLALKLTGSAEGTASSFPGYLTFTTTTGRAGRSSTSRRSAGPSPRARGRSSGPSSRASAPRSPSCRCRGGWTIPSATW